ncbi:hypothetical protein F4780DRAFT_731130 [Xylariomycetidae sp. FL0641]|nr:hypothetical protein F4780DRAFT_731130 [Xylariomycetidae sp. FL0641]
MPSLSTLAAAAALAPTALAQKYMMVFGDSYSSTGFWPTSGFPSAANPLGNPALPGQTTSGGLNWVGNLASQVNTTTVFALDFAQYGAVTDTDVVDTYTQYNFDDQVRSLFADNLVPAPEGAPWTPENTLAAVWVGINDIGEPFWDGQPCPVEAVLDVYFTLLQELYADGIRRFLLLTVPPFNHAPAFLDSDVTQLKSDIAAYNAGIASRLDAFAGEHGDLALAHVFDTAPSFEAALADPAAYGAADATCTSGDGKSCLWTDTYHPGTAIQRLVAEALVKEVDFF